MRQFLEVETHAESGNAKWFQPFEQPVIVSPAPAEAVSVFVESHSRNNGEIYFRKILKCFARGFENVKSSPLHEIFAAETAQFQIGFTHHNGQNHVFCCRRAENQIVCAWFIGQRMKKQNRLRRLEKHVVFKPAHYDFRHLKQRSTAVPAFQRRNLPAQFFLFHFSVYPALVSLELRERLFPHSSASTP